MTQTFRRQKRAPHSESFSLPRRQAAVALPRGAGLHLTASNQAPPETRLRLSLPGETPQRRPPPTCLDSRRPPDGVPTIGKIPLRKSCSPYAISLCLRERNPFRQASPAPLPRRASQTACSPRTQRGVKRCADAKKLLDFRGDSESQVHLTNQPPSNPASCSRPSPPGVCEESRPAQTASPEEPTLQLDFPTRNLNGEKIRYCRGMPSEQPKEKRSCRRVLFTETARVRKTTTRLHQLLSGASGVCISAYEARSKWEIGKRLGFGASEAKAAEETAKRDRVSHSRAQMRQLLRRWRLSLAIAGESILNYGKTTVLN